MTADLRRLVTPPQLAQRFRVHPETIRRRARHLGLGTWLVRVLFLTEAEADLIGADLRARKILRVKEALANG